MVSTGSPSNMKHKDGVGKFYSTQVCCQNQNKQIKRIQQIK